MKNTITNFALVLVAFVAVNLLMSFARPVAADEPKEYIVVSGMDFEKNVKLHLEQGWHLQGGVAFRGNFGNQAMVK